jgi:hypothetical protein
MSAWPYPLDCRFDQVRRVVSRQSTCILAHHSRLHRRKYGLAIVSKALDVLKERILMAYDIGCSFESTIRSSSLADQFSKLQWRICVNAFHGYTHNFGCQVKNHPNGIQGMGLEDLETLERVFSSSNQLAAVTRYASSYNRHVYIDLFFKNWDSEKYRNLGTMLYNNYAQALDIIATESPILAEAQKSLDVSDNDLKQWQAEQTAYFASLGKEPEYNVHGVAYVELLQKLRDTK